MTIFQDDAPHVTGTVITLTILAFLTFAARFYVRTTRGAWGIEDWIMTAAMVPFTVLSVACLGASFNGVGIHVERFSKPGNEKYAILGLFWFFLFEVFYCVTIIPVKLSIGFMLVRIASGRKPYVWSQYVIMGMFTTMNLIAALYIIFQCNPVSAAWDTSLLKEGGECQPAAYLADIYYATTAVNIFTDWFTALLPIPLLRNVKMNRNAKISVAAILSLGIFASLSACIRLKYTVNLTDSTDYLFGIANIMIWGYAENGVGVIVGNIATLRPLFRRILHLGGSDDSSGNAYGGRSGSRFGFNSGARKEFGPSYELGDGTENKSSKKNSPAALDQYGQFVNTTISGGRADRLDSSLDETESQREILEDVKMTGLGNHSIVVSRAVNVQSVRSPAHAQHLQRAELLSSNV